MVALQSTLRVFVIAGSLVACGASAEEPAPPQTLPIPERDSTYQYFVSRLLRSETDVDGFLSEFNARVGLAASRHNIEVERFGSSRTADRLAETLRDPGIDFDTECVALVFHTEGSGSIEVDMAPLRREAKDVTLVIEREVPAMQTMDMAYLAFAVRVARDGVRELRLPLGRRVYRVYNLRTGEEDVRRIPPFHQKTR